MVGCWGLGCGTLRAQTVSSASRSAMCDPHTCTVQAFRVRVQGSGFRVQGSEFRVQGSGFKVQGAGFRVQGAGCRVQGAVQVPGIGSGNCFRHQIREQFQDLQFSEAFVEELEAFPELLLRLHHLPVSGFGFRGSSSPPGPLAALQRLYRFPLTSQLWSAQKGLSPLQS